MKRTRLLVPCLLFALSAAADDLATLHSLYDRTWETRLRESPLFATSVGRHEYDDRLPSMTPADLERRHEQAKAALAELAAIDRSKLPAAEVVSYDIFRRQLEDALRSYELGDYQMPFNADSGFHTSFSRLPQDVPLATVKDYENYISRLNAWPRYVREEIALMRIGIKRGFTVPRATLDGYDNTMAAHVVDDPEKSVFWRPFVKFPPTVPESERERLRAAGRAAVMNGAVAGYRELLDFFRKEYLPGARTTLGAYDLPNGRAYYAQQIREYTTLDLAPEEIHKIGLAEVERISGEMDAVMKQVGFQGDFAAFLRFLRTDPRFYAKTPDELLARAAWIAKRMDGKLPSLFKTLPRLPYTVEPVPADIAPKYTSGRYVSAPEGSTRPGIYWVNTYQLESRPLYNLEALTLHESVPGHHLQIAISRELTDLPNFRRFYYISAFGEGWGLYCEWLGIEAGFYTDPYSNFGRLTYEMWRACRLVVDTGIHSMGWTRRQAIDYLASRTALPLHEVETEVDRYISWPGQALSYKLGELKIQELRKRAESALGTRFDVREFHDVVLGSGAVPLSVLEGNVDRWIAGQRPATPQTSGNEFTLYDLLPPESHQFAITYDVTQTREGAEELRNPIRPGSTATNERVISPATGQDLPFDVDAQAIRVHLPAPVPKGGETRIRILKTYTDAPSYSVKDGLLVFDRPLGIKRNVVLLPAGWSLASSASPAIVSTDPDGRTRLSFLNDRDDQLPVKITARRAGGSPAGPPAASPAVASFHRADQDREIRYWLLDPSTHQFRISHDFTVSRPGQQSVHSFVRKGSAVSPDAKMTDLDTGRALPTHTVTGKEVNALGYYPEPADPDSVVVQGDLAQPIAEGRSTRVRVEETYTDAVGYTLDGDELVWKRTLGRPLNFVTLPAGWSLASVNTPAVIALDDEGRVRLRFTNPRNDELSVVIRARRTPPV